tara:strand:+ start:1107 stop:1355 length:249 start_codon:yes stop_codon:yes gene_type:complete
MTVKPSKTFISKLKNSFRKHSAEFELVRIDEEKETLLVNGEEISFEWYPHIDDIQGNDLIEVLLKDCKKEIRSMLKEVRKAS